MTSDRLIAELLVGFLLIGIIVVLWEKHDRTEQAIATTACVAKVESTGEAQTVKTNDTNLDNANMLSQVVASYDQKIRDLNADRDTLAQRVHDTETARGAVRSSTVSSLSAPSGFVCTAADDGRPTDRDRREAVNLEACAANTIELTELREAWADMAAGKAATKP